MKTNYITTTLSAIAVLAVLVVGYIMGAHTMLAKAAMLAFSPGTCYTASATTSPAYLTVAGALVNATSTVACNLGADGADSATIIAQVTASSTFSTYVFEFEESQDGIDWYPVISPETASTSNPFYPNQRLQYRYTFSSTTPPSVIGNATQATSSVIFDVPVRLQRVRASVYMASSTGSQIKNGAIWMKIVPRQPIN